ncbi:HD-GYP domain-containing protein (c-di-GMP phosphodiesterase class II) [Azospirillum agricola]|uniref:HD domain-containing phosphohydrolase n=1 Tax=Azospirillum agricola TaxID=1720247 RepID=UPI001AE2B2AD|nr:HD domain-containing phosphohydrolase [Azospirillum agricola]MBP2227047.1 HD-GYP domain-containing protein (c-di-GMP phosphodiesterase class II) [Azospirillum agricola]
MGLVGQFLEFIEQTPNQSLRAISDRVLHKCRELTDAEAGSVFMLSGQGRARQLEAVSVQNDVIRAKTAAFTIPVASSSIVGHVAITGETVLIDDAYALGETKPYRFNPGFDQRTGFRTRSIMAFALKGFRGKPVGVVQLINRRDPQGGDPLPFLLGHEAMIAPVNHLVGRALERAATLERLKERNRALTQERRRVAELQKETERAFMISVNLLARAAEVHDEDTGNHIVRVNEYSYILAKWAGCSKAFCEELRFSAALHDVGKMSVDQAVLHKRGRLDERELAEMRRHPVYGYEILKTSDRLKMAAEVALSHHEQWAGTGYPNGLKGEEIPLAARIVAIADCYDALRSKRPYKPAFSHDKTVNILTLGDDRIDPTQHFDPRLIALFAERHMEFDRIWEELRDEEPAAEPVPA